MYTWYVFLIWWRDNFKAISVWSCTYARRGTERTAHVSKNRNLNPRPSRPQRTDHHRHSRRCEDNPNICARTTFGPRHFWPVGQKRTELKIRYADAGWGERSVKVIRPLGRYVTFFFTYVHLQPTCGRLNQQFTRARWGVTRNVIINPVK